MPAGYAHYCFGRDVYFQLPKAQQNLIRKNIHIFDIAVHGPDLTFYYLPENRNGIVQTGISIHNAPGLEFFKPASAVLRNSGYPDKDRAFIYGYLCHFALDLTCHPYVNQRVLDCNIPHYKTEAEFDRYMMELDHVYNPAGKSIVTHIYPSIGAAKVMEKYYPNLNYKQLYTCMHSMIFMLNFLTMPNKLVREVLFPLFDLVGARSFKDLVIPFTPDPLCEESNIELHDLYKKAVPLAVKLINEFDAIASGALPWTNEYLVSFDPPSLKDGEYEPGIIEPVE